MKYTVNTYPLRLRFDLLLFFAVINMPVGVNGFTFATGLSNLV